MTPLKQAITKVQDGWSAKRHISERAFAMKPHLESGNRQRAVELATEICILQGAEKEARPSGFTTDRTGQEEWHLSLEIWGSIMRSGGWKVSRSIFVAQGSTDEQAAAYARTRFSLPITAKDLEPLFPASRMAAE